MILVLQDEQEIVLEELLLLILCLYRQAAIKVSVHELVETEPVIRVFYLVRDVDDQDE